MSDPTGGQMLIGVKVERQGGEVLPQVRREVKDLGVEIVHFGDAMRDVTGTTGQVVQPAQQGARGLNLLRGAMTSLAFQATGTAGPIGNVASKLLQFGAGATVVVGAAAGLAVVGFALRELTRDARENAEAQETLATKLEGIGTHGAVTAARIRLGQLERQRDDPTFFERAGQAGRAFLGPLLGGASFAEQQERLNRAIAEQLNILNAAERRFQAPREQTRRDANLGLEEAQLRARLALQRASTIEVTEAVRALRLEVGEHYPRALAQSIAATERYTAELDVATDAQLAARDVVGEAEIRMGMLWASTEDVTEAIRRYKLELRGVPGAVAAATAADERWAAHQTGLANTLRNEIPRAFEAIGEAAVEGFDAAAQAIVGSFVDIMRSLPGLTLAQASVLGLFSGIVQGLFGGGGRGVRIDEFSQRALDQQRQNRGDPDRFTLQIFSTSTGELLDEIEYELGFRARLDRVIRIPRSVRMMRR